MSDGKEVKAWTLEQIMSKHLEPDRPLMGPWVEESDHDRIVAELRSEVAQAKREAADAMSGCCDCPMFKAKGKTVARQARVIEKLNRCLLGFTEYFKAIKKGEVGPPREKLRSFELVLLDSSESLLKELEAIEQGEGT